MRFFSNHALFSCGSNDSMRIAEKSQEEERADSAEEAAAARVTLDEKELDELDGRARLQY